MAEHWSGDGLLAAALALHAELLKRHGPDSTQERAFLADFGHVPGLSELAVCSRALARAAKRRAARGA